MGSDSIDFIHRSLGLVQLAENQSSLTPLIFLIGCGTASCGRKTVNSEISIWSASIFLFDRARYSAQFGT